MSAEGDELGPGRALAVVYALFALAAGARSAVQIATGFDEAPLPYCLSAVAAVVYLVAALTLARPGRRALVVGTVACAVELAGVLVVGTLSVVDPTAFPDETVWSEFGSGYGYLPLLLPLLGLAWAARRWRALN